MVKEKYIQNIKETTINIANSQVESIRLKDDTKTSFRIYKDGYIGVAGAIGKYDEAELEKEAMDALSQKIEYPCEASGNKNEKISRKTDFIKDEELAEEIDEFLKELTAAQPEFLFYNKVILQEINTKLVNDNNLKLEYEDKSISFGIVFKEKTSKNIMDGFLEFNSRKYDRKLALEESNMILNAYKNKVELPKEGKYPIVFPVLYAPVNKLIMDLNAHLFASGSSLLSDKLNTQAFSKDFTFYQTLNPEDVFNTTFFDSEGVVNKDYRYALIEDGVVKAPYKDKRTAKKYGFKETGTSAAPYDGIPTLQLSSFKIGESEKTIKELLKGEMGIVVIITSGGDFNSSGDYGAPVQLAMLFDGEKFIGRLPEFQISSNLFDMYGSSFRGVGRDKVLPYSDTKFAVMDMKISNI